MAELKRPVAGQSYKTPRIGVVNVRTGSDKAAAAKGDFYKIVSDAGFRVAASLSQSAGEEYGKEAVTRDSETGEITVKELPNQLLMGGAGTSAALKQMAAQYEIKETINLKNAAVDLSLESKGDPEVFKELWSSYSSEKEALIAGSNASLFLEDYKNLSAQYGSDTYNNLRLKKVQAANDLAESNARTFIQDAARGVNTLISNGGISEGRELALHALERYKSSGVSPDAYASTERKFIQNQSAAIVNYAVKANAANSRDLKRLSSEATLLGWSEESLKKSPQLKEVQSADTETWNKISTNLSELSGKINSEEIKIKEDQNASMRFQLGVSTPEDSDKIFREARLTGLEFLGDPNSIESRELIAHANEQGQYSTNQVNLFEAVVSGRSGADSLAVQNAVTFFDRTKERSTTRGVVKTNNGLDPVTYSRMRFLSNWRASYGNARLQEGLDVINASISNPDLLDKVKVIGGSEVEFKDSDNFMQSIKKLSDNILDDYPPTVRERLYPVVAEQVRLGDSLSDVESATKEYFETISRPSQYLSQEEASIYAPELFFERSNQSALIEDSPEEFGDTYIDYFINKELIDRNGLWKENLDIRPDEGNVRLVPIETKSDHKRAMYFLENTETGEFLTRSDGKYLVFDTDMVKHKATQLRMKKVRKISKAQKEAEAAQARDELDFEQTTLGRQFAQGM
jgi:hypothetical protein